MIHAFGRKPNGLFRVICQVKSVQSCSVTCPTSFFPFILGYDSDISMHWVSFNWKHRIVHVFVRVSARMRARACVRACVCVCVCERERERERENGEERSND